MTLPARDPSSMPNKESVVLGPERVHLDPQRLKALIARVMERLRDKKFRPLDQS